MSIALPMIECSSCGRCLGHLYEDYYNLGLRLTDLMSKHSVTELASADHTQDFTTPNSGDNWNEFLKPYFQYVSEHPEEAHPEHSAFNLVSRSLLRLKKREQNEFPLGKKINGQRPVYESKYCCMRMFMCDSSRSFY